MSEPIEKIGDIGIGSNYNSGQVYCFKCWKIKGGNLYQAHWVIRRVIWGVNGEDRALPNLTYKQTDTQRVEPIIKTENKSYVSWPST